MGKGDPRNAKVKARALRRRAGRPTKPGLRKADGRLSQAKDARPYVPPPPVPAVENRMREHDLCERDAKSKFAGTGHGVAFLKGFISYEGYQIADQYARLRHAFERTTHRGPREPASAAIPYDREFIVTLEQSSPDGEAHTSNTDKVETPEEREARVRRSWNQVLQALSYSAAVPNVLNDVIVRNQSFSDEAAWQLDTFVKGLQALAKIWGRNPRDVFPASRQKEPPK